MMGGIHLKIELGLWVEHIIFLQMKENPYRLCAYDNNDFIVAYYNNLLECWETESYMDYIQWENVKR